jgi:NAD+---dinitrogen-reductase ADP-D-ribosyltransferase
MKADTGPGAVGVGEATLPPFARLPINRCNLPPVILGGLTFQRHPAPLALDGVAELHRALFHTLQGLAEPAERAQRFRDYMTANFRLDHPEEAGLTAERQGAKRDKADYLRILRGWLFDADGREGAVLKSWVESRFGLLPRSHGGPLGDYGGANYQRYLAARAQGLYNTNALESQLDLLYTYCQYELERQHPGRSHLRLYRGTNRLEEYDILQRADRHQGRDKAILLLNNLNSCTSNRERAGEFGDYILALAVPQAKLLFFPGLLPGMLRGEEEFLVIGGVYEAVIGYL